MTFKVDNVDYSSKVEVVGYKVTPRRVYGGARGDLLNGESVADLIVIKKDLEIAVVSTVEADTASIATALMKEYVSLEFSDPITATNISGTYEPEMSAIEMALDVGEAIGTAASSNRYWYGFQISFKQK